MSDQQDHFQSIIEASENDFEKKLFVINTGALTLSVGFIENIVALDGAAFKWLLISGWVLLIINLLVNLGSHLASSKRTFDLQYRIASENEEHETLLLQAKKDTECIRRINWATVWLLTIGVVLIVAFISINII